MNSYENAPATKLIATNCACCGRALVDAVSVEAGIGPECREKHGYSEAQGEPNWTAAAVCLASVQIDGGSAIVALPEDAHKAVNWLTYRIAIEQTGPNVLAYTNAIRALGYSKLAARLEKRLARVRIETANGRYVVHTPYSPEAVDAFRQIHGRKWEPESKAWSFPAEFKKAVWEILCSYFAGSVGMGPKGLFQIGG